MDINSAPKAGFEATDKLLVLYKQLFAVLGSGNLLYEKPKEDSNDVPKKCEETNKVVSNILNSMKELLISIRKAYSICKQDFRPVEQMKMVDLLNNSKAEYEVERSEEYKTLYKDLQQKNKEIKYIIDEVREIFSIIGNLNQM